MERRLGSSEIGYEPEERAIARSPKRCGGRMRGGKYCRKPAGFNTDHPGIGPCKRHGGNIPTTLKSVGSELAHKGIMSEELSAADMIEIEPHNGLLLAVRSSAGEFFYWQSKVRDFPKKIMYVREMREARMQMARLSKMALDAGLAERQVEMQERMADLMARFALTVFADMQLTPQQERQVPKLIQGALLSLESAEDFTKIAKPALALRNYKKSDIIELEAS